MGPLAFVLLVRHESDTLPALESPSPPQRCSSSVRGQRAEVDDHALADAAELDSAEQPEPLDLGDLRARQLAVAAAPAVTVRRGTMHSCGLTPPCSYSLSPRST